LDCIPSLMISAPVRVKWLDAKIEQNLGFYAGIFAIYQRQDGALEPRTGRAVVNNGKFTSQDQQLSRVTVMRGRLSRIAPFEMLYRHGPIGSVWNRLAFMTLHSSRTDNRLCSLGLS
jgi:hypothetical protein